MCKDCQLKAISELIVRDVKYLERNLSEIAQTGPLTQKELINLYMVSLFERLYPLTTIPPMANIPIVQQWLPGPLHSALDDRQYLAHYTFADTADQPTQCTEPEPTPDDKPQKTYTFLKNK